jgi:hypothetical protein
MTMASIATAAIAGPSQRNRWCIFNLVFKVFSRAARLGKETNCHPLMIVEQNLTDASRRFRATCPDNPSEALRYMLDSLVVMAPRASVVFYCVHSFAAVPAAGHVSLLRLVWTYRPGRHRLTLPGLFHRVMLEDHDFFLSPEGRANAAWAKHKPTRRIGSRARRDCRPPRSLLLKSRPGGLPTGAWN